MTTFITRLNGNGWGSGLGVAVKDVIDVAGLVTTAGTRARIDEPPASTDALCLAGLRAAMARGEARLVGKTNLHELALGVTGINPWFGTPVNPLDPALVPGGSSSGSATAVASGDADVAFGTDTGGSVRIPAACCGIAGLKTTWGRVPTEGVWPLAPSLDTVGPMARDVAGVVAGMALLEPTFEAGTAATRVGWHAACARPEIADAVRLALDIAGLAVQPVTLPGWQRAHEAGLLLLAREAWTVDRVLLEQRPEALGADVRDRLLGGEGVSKDAVVQAEGIRALWREELSEVLAEVGVLVMPTLTDFPPRIDNGRRMHRIRLTVPVNVAGVPALALPVPTRTFPASVQLIGPPGSEETLVATGFVLERATRMPGRLIPSIR